MSYVRLGQDAVSYEEITSPMEMRRVINMLETENAKLKEKLEMLTDIIAPLMKPNSSNAFLKMKMEDLINKESEICNHSND